MDTPTITAMRDCALDVITACVRRDRATAAAGMARLQGWMLRLQVPALKTQGAIADVAMALTLLTAAKAAYDALLLVADDG